MKYTIKLEIGTGGVFNKTEIVNNNQKEILDEVILVLKEIPKCNLAIEIGKGVISNFYLQVTIKN